MRSPGLLQHVSDFGSRGAHDIRRHQPGFLGASGKAVGSPRWHQAMAETRTSVVALALTAIKPANMRALAASRGAGRSGELRINRAAGQTTRLHEGWRDTDRAGYTAIYHIGFRRGKPFQITNEIRQRGLFSGAAPQPDHSAFASLLSRQSGLLTRHRGAVVRVRAKCQDGALSGHGAGTSANCWQSIEPPA